MYFIKSSKSLWFKGVFVKASQLALALNGKIFHKYLTKQSNKRIRKHKISEYFHSSKKKWTLAVYVSRVFLVFSFFVFVWLILLSIIIVRREISFSHSQPIQRNLNSFIKAKWVWHEKRNLFFPFLFELFQNCISISIFRHCMCTTYIWECLTYVYICI